MTGVQTCALPIYHIIFNAPYGERILVNDDKPSGLHMSIGINKKRDEKLCINIEEDSML